MPHGPRLLSSLLLGALSQGGAKSLKQLVPLGHPHKSGRERAWQESGGTRPRSHFECKEERERAQGGVITQGGGPRSRNGCNKAGQGSEGLFLFVLFLLLLVCYTNNAYCLLKKKHLKIPIKKGQMKSF